MSRAPVTPDANVPFGTGIGRNHCAYRQRLMAGLVPPGIGAMISVRWQSLNLRLQTMPRGRLPDAAASLSRPDIDLHARPVCRSHHS